MTKDQPNPSRRDDTSLTVGQRPTDKRLKAAGLRMALKLLPPDVLAQAPAKLEAHFAERLRNVSPHEGEAGACYLIAPHAHDGHLRVMTVALDEQNAVSRIVSETTLDEIFKAILDNMKEL